MSCLQSKLVLWFTSIYKYMRVSMILQAMPVWQETIWSGNKWTFMVAYFCHRVADLRLEDVDIFFLLCRHNKRCWHLFCFMSSSLNNMSTYNEKRCRLISYLPRYYHGIIISANKLISRHLFRYFYILCMVAYFCHRVADLRLKDVANDRYGWPHGLISIINTLHIPSHCVTIAMGDRMASSPL